jgi:antitoxin HicB
MRYPIKVEKIDDEFIATISHPNGRFQGACSGPSKSTALAHISKLISVMIASAINDGDPIPSAKTCDKGNAWILLPPMLAAKAAIYEEMRIRGKRKADIAKALGVNQKQVDRILNPAHHSTLLQLEAAAKTLGKQIELRLA